MSGILIETCATCGARWYLPRDLCPACGGRQVSRIEATGTGKVYSVTTQHRAPSRDFPQTPPWRVALVDLDDGPRVMGHVDGDAQIGSRVRGRTQEFGGATVPAFTTETEESENG